MPASAIDRLQTPLRNRAMEQISRNARRLRGGQFMGASGHLLPIVGNGDAFEGLLTRLGIIPIVVIPNPTSLTGTIQAFPGRRPSTSENISVLGATAGTSFAVGDPAKSVAFSAGGTGQVLTATDSVDAQAKGRALIDIVP
jgi:hypothetical protein